jgi:hypothetical protein
MDRDTAEHLARDTGLRPEDIADDLQPLTDEVTEHLAADTGIDEANVAEGGANPMANMIGGLPVD